MMSWLGKLLGIERLESIDSVRLGFAAPWAHQRPALVLFCCVALAAVAAIFYMRYQVLRKKKARVSMAIFRAVLLVMLLIILAEPIIALQIKSNPRPLVLMLFDGTDSMNIRDRLSPDSRSALQGALGAEAPKFDEDQPPTRQDLVRAAIRSRKVNLLQTLGEKFRVRAYVLNQPDDIREIAITTGESDTVDAAALADKIQGKADVTALGTALDKLRLRSRSNLLAGVVVFSDFDQNRGSPLLEAAGRLNVPVHAVGLGPRQAKDLWVELETPRSLKRGERTSVTVTLHQSGLAGRDARIELRARRLGTAGTGSAEAEEFHRVAPVKTVRIVGESDEHDIDDYVPEATGRFVLQAYVEPFGDEKLRKNNFSEPRQVLVRDESLKLLFVEYEPTWEWRFMKEVFHRHPLIGREGFRTYLDSADWTVRRSNELFVETLTRSREEFFSYDVIFLSDVPAKTLTPHFQNMLDEYVNKFGGPLVVIAGPRFGTSALVGTKVADMLPVVLGDTPRRRDGQFSLRLTNVAKKYKFMFLGQTAQDEQGNRQGWGNLAKLQWYQQSRAPHPQAWVLADHPTDRCVDGQKPQPLIAIRRCGRGEVVYFAFNETWRLRRLYGEQYYARLWGQLIYRLGQNREIGPEKRFRVRTDRDSYEAGQKVRIMVEAYNRDYEPLGDKQLSARLLAPRTAGVPQAPARLSIPLSRGDVNYETSLPAVYTPGQYRVLVKDPVTGGEVEVTFMVESATAERRSAVRNTAKQRVLAEQTKGKTYELHEVAKVPGQIKDRPIVEYSERRFPLWNTWLVLSLVLVLMLGEWLTRKLLNLQ